MEWVQDGRGDSTRVTYGYDAFGAVSSVRSARAAAAGEAATLVGYHPASGNVVSTTSPLGFITRYMQDEIGRDTVTETPIDGLIVGRTRVWYDVSGQDTLSITYGDTLEGNLVVRTQRDSLGRTKMVERWSTRGDTTVLSRRWEYDRADRPIIEFAEDGALTRIVYDHAGNLIRRTAPRNAVVTATYDVLNRPVQRITSAPSPYNRITWSLQAVTGQVMKIDSFPHRQFADVNGRFAVSGDTVDFGYDPVTGAMTRADNRDAWVRRTYYPNGQLATDTLRIRTWDRTGPADFDAHRYALAYTYDLNGRRATLRHPANIAPAHGTTGAVYDLQQYGYEPGLGALASVTGVLGTRYGFAYDADGRPRLTTLPGARTQEMTYDADGRLAGRVDRAPNYNLPTTMPRALNSVGFSYDSRGKAVEIEANGRSSTFGYSRIGSLVQARGSGGAAANLAGDETMAPAGDLSASIQPGGGGIMSGLYRVDALGRRLQETRFGTSMPTVYDYDDYGRMVSGHPSEENIYADGAVPLYQENRYDGAGNQEWYILRHYAAGMVSATRSFYDGNQRLVAADKQTCIPKQNGIFSGSNVPNYECLYPWSLHNGTSGSFEWYRYDALGRRVLVRTTRDHVCQNSACSSTITRFVWDGDQILYEIRGMGGKYDTSYALENDNATGSFYGRVAYTHGPGIDQPLDIVRMGFPLGLDASYGLDEWGGPYPLIPFTDWQGVMEGVTTPTGRKLPCATRSELCSTGVWPASNLGVFYEPSVPAEKQVWFGSLTDGKTDGSGFMYMRNRYYNPQTGTFTQPDPIGIAGGLNVYGFADGDPVMYGDPYGLSADTLKYNGSRATLVGDDGKEKWSGSASSGLQGATAEDQERGFYGPIPEGTYTLNPQEIVEAPVGSRLHMTRNTRGDWGTFWVPLHPDAGTNTFGRDGFHLHNPTTADTYGCIGVSFFNSTALFRMLQGANGPVTVKVEYPSSGTVTSPVRMKSFSSWWSAP